MRERDGGKEEPEGADIEGKRERERESRERERERERERDGGRAKEVSGQPRGLGAGHLLPIGSAMLRAA